MLRPKALIVTVVVFVLLLTSSLFASEPDSILVIFESEGIGGGTGWVDNCTAVILATETDSVGIGTNTPIEKLDIDGRIRMSQHPAPTPTTDKLYNTGGNLFWNGAQLTGGGGILPTGTSGQTLRHSGSGWSAVDNLYNDGTNIGIGTTSPAYPLDLQADQAWLLNVKRTTANASRMRLETPDATMGFELANTGAFNIEVPSGYERISITPEGNVGIGNTSPTAQLSLGSNASNTKLAIYDNGTYLVGMGVAANQYRLHLDGPASRFSFLDAPAGNELVTIKGSGNVGIGTTSPSSKLEVSEAGLSVRVTGNIIGFDRDGAASYIDQTGTGDIQFRMGSSYTDALRISNTGNIGIGTSDPKANLHITKTGTITNIGTKNARILIENNTGTVNAGGEIVFTYNGDVNNERYAALGVAAISNPATGGTGRIYLATKTNNADTLLTERLSILPNGYVGIGTTEPGAKLDVNGYIQTHDDLPFSVKRYTGTLNASGSTTFAHGISLAYKKVVLALGYCKGNSGEMKPLNFNYIDGGNISFTGGIANRAYRITIVYSSSPHNW